MIAGPVITKAAGFEGVARAQLTRGCGGSPQARSGRHYGPIRIELYAAAKCRGSPVSEGLPSRLWRKVRRFSPRRRRVAGTTNRYSRKVGSAEKVDTSSPLTSTVIICGTV